MRIKIIMPVATDKFNDATLREAERFLPKGTEIDVENLDSGTMQIESMMDEGLNCPGIIAICKKIENQNYDGVFISCMADPAIDAAREILDIPVVAPCRISCAVAAELADKFSIITVVPSVIHTFENILRKYGLCDFVASVRSIDIPVSDLMDTKILLQKLFESSLEAIRNDGAKAIVLGCTGILGIEDQLSQQLKQCGHNIPVVYPVSVSLRYLDLLISSNLSQSKASYMHPPIISNDDAQQKHHKLHSRI